MVQHPSPQTAEAGQLFIGRGATLAFIDYFNRTMAKPFKWTYAGRPLTA